ncbi:hypothetical protein, partial [Enterobacter hormaechei]
YGSGKSAWEAYQSGNYWAAAGWGLLAVGEVGLTVATLGSSNLVTTAIRGTRAAAMGVRGAEAARAVAKAE